MRKTMYLIASLLALAMCWTGCDTDTDTETKDDDRVFQTAFGAVAGGKRLVSQNYLCTITIGDAPGHMPSIESETYRVRLGVGPKANQ